MCGLPGVYVVSGRLMPSLPAAFVPNSARAHQKGGRRQDRDGSARVHWRQTRVAGDNHLGIHRQRLGKKLIVFRVTALAHKLLNFNHTQVSQQPFDKCLARLRAGIPVKL